jgi:hypothetical protein
MLISAFVPCGWGRREANLNELPNLIQIDPAGRPRQGALVADHAARLWSIATPSCCQPDEHMTNWWSSGRQHQRVLCIPALSRGHSL